RALLAEGDRAPRGGPLAALSLLQRGVAGPEHIRRGGRSGVRPEGSALDDGGGPARVRRGVQPRTDGASATALVHAVRSSRTRRAPRLPERGGAAHDTLLARRRGAAPPRRGLDAPGAAERDHRGAAPRARLSLPRGRRHALVQSGLRRDHPGGALVVTRTLHPFRGGARRARQRGEGLLRGCVDARSVELLEAPGQRLRSPPRGHGVHGARLAREEAPGAPAREVRAGRRRERRLPRAGSVGGAKGGSMRCSAGILCRALLCRALLCRALLFGVGALAVSCGGSTPSPGPAPLSAVRVEVVAHPTANHGRSVRMLVREIDGPTTFLTDEYGAMVRLATQPDESVLADRFLRPGTTLDLQVTPHPEKSLAVYVFFSTPHATKWKARLPDGRTTVRLEVLENAVEVR